MTQNNLVLLTAFMPLFAAVVTLTLVADREWLKQYKIQHWVGLIASAITWGSSLILLAQVVEAGPQTYRMGGYVPPYGIVLVADMLSALFVVMASTVMLAGMIYTLQSHEKVTRYPAFVPLFLCMEVGLNGAFLTGDLFTFFVFMELMVLSSVSLVAISDNRFGLEAAIKYIFISGMGTLFLLVGITAMYTSLGTLNLAHMGQLLASGERPLLASAAALMLTSAFLLKSAVFPFHFWQPDFHTTAPTAVSAMLSSVIVKVGIYGIIRLLTLLFTVEAPQLQNILMQLGIIGIFFGGFAALRTHNGKRLLAYSTIGQVGFILLAIGWGSTLALAAAIVYAFNHAFVKSSLLMLMGIVASHNKEHSIDMQSIAGVGQYMPPLVGVLWFMGGMSLAGIPPMNGFISKLVIVQSGVDMMAWIPLGLAVASGSLTLLYMFRTWQKVFQQKKALADIPLNLISNGDGIFAPAFLLTISLLLGLYARPLIVLAEQTALQLANPDIYINAVNLFGG